MWGRFGSSAARSGGCRRQGRGRRRSRGWVTVLRGSAAGRLWLRRRRCPERAAMLLRAGAVAALGRRVGRRVRPVGARRPVAAAGGAARGRRRRRRPRDERPRERRQRRRPAGGARSASSSWSLRPPGPDRVGSMEASRRAAARERRRSGRSETTGAPRPSEATSAMRSRSMACSVKARRSRPCSSSPSRISMPAIASPERGRPGRLRSSLRRPDPALLEPGRPSGSPISVASSWSSIDSASRMPPAARRATRSIASGSAVRPSAFEDASQLAGDLARPSSAGSRTAGRATGPPGGCRCCRSCRRRRRRGPAALRAS